MRDSRHYADFIMVSSLKAVSYINFKLSSCICPEVASYCPHVPKKVFKTHGIHTADSWTWNFK
jgi:hypothetical protein